MCCVIEPNLLGMLLSCFASGRVRKASVLGNEGCSDYSCITAQFKPAVKLSGEDLLAFLPALPSAGHEESHTRSCAVLALSKESRMNGSRERWKLRRAPRLRFSQLFILG